MGPLNGQAGAEARFPAAACQQDNWEQSTTGARYAWPESEQRELSNVRDPYDDLIQRKRSTIVN